MATKAKVTTKRPDPMVAIAEQAMRDYLVVVLVPRLGENATAIATRWFADYLKMGEYANRTGAATDSLKWDTVFSPALIDRVAELTTKAVDRALKPSAADRRFEADVAYALKEEDIADIMGNLTARVAIETWLECARGAGDSNRHLRADLLYRRLTKVKAVDDTTLPFILELQRALGRAKSERRRIPRRRRT